MVSMESIKVQMADTFNMIKVGDIMLSPAVSVKENDDFSAVQKKFLENHLPYVCVTDDGQKLVGTISQKYLYKAQSPRKIIGDNPDYDPDIIVDGDSFYSKEVLDSYILSQIMNHIPFTMKHDQSLKEAIINMATKHLGCIPIVDESNKLSGVVTEQLIIKYIAERFFQ